MQNAHAQRWRPRNSNQHPGSSLPRASAVHRRRPHGEAHKQAMPAAVCSAAQGERGQHHCARCAHQVAVSASVHQHSSRREVAVFVLNACKRTSAQRENAARMQLARVRCQRVQEGAAFDDHATTAGSARSSRRRPLRRANEPASLPPAGTHRSLATALQEPIFAHRHGRAVGLAATPALGTAVYQLVPAPR